MKSLRFTLRIVDLKKDTAGTLARESKILHITRLRQVMPSEESNKQVLLCLAPRQLILKLTHIALVDRVGFINTICKNDPKCGNLSVPFKDIVV